MSNSVCFIAVVFQIRVCRKMSQKISQHRRRVFRKTPGQRATKLLLLRPCKTLVVDGLREYDPVARIQFCNWFRQSVYDGVCVQKIQD
jgi:hypothetical protein